MTDDKTKVARFVERCLDLKKKNEDQLVDEICSLLRQLSTDDFILVGGILVSINKMPYELDQALTRVGGERFAELTAVAILRPRVSA